jgi:hypothetical protein
VKVASNSPLPFWPGHVLFTQVDHYRLDILVVALVDRLVEELGDSAVEASHAATESVSCLYSWYMLDREESIIAQKVEERYQQRRLRLSSRTNEICVC